MKATGTITTGDPFQLQRFMTAQAPVFDAVLDELRAGRKRTHWMWFIFPQVRGLGNSAMARLYGIGSLDEARAYLAHPVLGSRLILCTQTVLGVSGLSLNAIFGSPDDTKFRSSMTLFSLAAQEAADPFRDAIDLYCEGVADERTLAIIQAQRA